MRNIITLCGCCIGIYLMVIVFCIFTEEHARSAELNNGSEYAMNILKDEWMSGTLQMGAIPKEEEIEHITRRFCEELKKKIASNGEVEVQIIYAGNGVLDVLVHETFRLPLIYKNKKISIQRVLLFSENTV